MSIEQLAVGEWEYVESENFDEYMKAIGIGGPTRLIAKKLKPTFQVSTQNGEWSLKFLSTFKNTETKFKIGEPFEEKTPDGRTVQTIVTIEGNKLIQAQQGTQDSTVREFFEDKLIVTLTGKGVVATRTFKRKA